MKGRRPDHQIGEAALAARTNHEERGACRFLDQDCRRPTPLAFG